MSLKNCKECGAEISSSAKECPKCGKEQRNIITKHPIISVIVAIGLLGVFTYIVTPKPNYESTISRNTNNTETTNSKEQTEETLKISIGDIITGKDWEINLESVNFSQKVEPPVKNLYYNYYQVKDSSNTYLYIVLNCKNISTLDLEASAAAAMTVKYDNKYTYSSFTAIPDDTLGFTYTSLTKVKPLTSQKIYYLAEMPKNISEETDTTIDINIKFENKTYIYQYR